MDAAAREQVEIRPVKDNHQVGRLQQYLAGEMRAMCGEIKATASGGGDCGGRTRPSLSSAQRSAYYVDIRPTGAECLAQAQLSVGAATDVAPACHYQAQCPTFPT